MGGVATGYAAGAGAATLVGGGLIGGVGGVGGGGVAYGVGDFAHNLFEENWGGDIHRYGVAEGVLYGIGDAEVQTGKDFAHTADDIGHAAEDIWNSIF